jgi:hypothetical protein
VTLPWVIRCEVRVWVSDATASVNSNINGAADMNQRLHAKAVQIIDEELRGVRVLRTLQSCDCAVVPTLRNLAEHERGLCAAAG